MAAAELLITMAAAGIAAGIASGLFGIGGGVIIVPAVMLLTGFGFREAVAASLLSITITSPLGVFQHHRAGNVLWREGFTLGAAGFIGVLGAQFADQYLTERHLVWGFAVLLVYASNRLAYGQKPLIKIHGLVNLLLVGALSGLVAKFFGIGGGILIVPALVFIGRSIHQAVATSLVAVVANAALATLVNLAFLRPLDWVPWSLPVAAGALGGVFLGARTGIRTKAEPLRRGFAVLLLLVTIVLLHGSL